MSDKKTVNIKRVLMFAGAICACLIGSGFATGQEILQFFASSGVKGIGAALIFFVVMSSVIYKLCSVAQKKQFENPYDVFEYYCGKMIGKAYIWYCVVLNYCIFVVMLAGGGATINQNYKIPSYIGTAVIAVIAMISVIVGVDKIIKIIGVIGPVNIFFLALLGIASIVTLTGNHSLLTIGGGMLSKANIKTASSNWAWSGVLYACLCLMTSVPFVVNCGTSVKNQKEAKYMGVIGIAAFTIAIIMLIIAELVNYKIIIGKQVPTLVIAAHVSPLLEAVFSILIILAIYSAASSILLMTVRKFSDNKTKKFNALAIVFTLVGILFGGILPFDKLVNILYPIAGYSAIIFIGFMLYREITLKHQNKVHIKTKKQTYKVNPGA